MKITKLQIFRDNKIYIFEPYTGLLLEKNNINFLTCDTILCDKVIKALEINHNPYIIQKINNYENEKKIKINKINILYVRLLIKICKTSFLLTRIFTKLRLPIYNNSTESIIAFRKIVPSSIQNDLCLPRALFAAITSKKFKEKGVVFIGVFLPSKSMHAWVIEDGVQPDLYDNMWINFEPVAALW